MPYAPKPKKKAAPKGGGRAASGTNLYTPVRQSTIDKIKGLGMTASLKRAASSQNAEFIEGVKRMYGADRLKAAMKKAAAPAPRTSRTTSATAPKMAQPRTSRTTSATAKPTSIPKQIGIKPKAGKLPYYYTEAEKAYVKANGKPKSSSAPISKQKPTKAQIAYGKARKA